MSPHVVLLCPAVCAQNWRKHAWSPAPVLFWGVITAVLSGPRPLPDRGPQAGWLLRRHGRTQGPGRGEGDPRRRPVSESRVWPARFFGRVQRLAGSSMWCRGWNSSRCYYFSRLCFLLFRRPLEHQADKVLFLQKALFPSSDSGIGHLPCVPAQRALREVCCNAFDRGQRHRLDETFRVHVTVNCTVFCYQKNDAS